MRAQGLFVCGCLLLLGTLAALAYCSFLHNKTDKHPGPAAPSIVVPTRVGESTPLPKVVAPEWHAVVDASAARPAPAPAAPAAPEPASESRVLRVAKAFPDGGGFNWDSGTGTPEEIRFNGQKILSKAKRGTYCCGFTFAVAMRAASDTGLLNGKSVAQIRKFQQHWYAATPEAREKQQIYALEWLGIGRQVPLMDARPGDFVRLWHGSSGHSVIFVRWIEQDGLKVGLEYRGTQGSTNGIGNRIEYLPRTPGHAEGDFELERTYVGRLNEAGRAGASLDSLDKLIDRSPRFQQLCRVSSHSAFMVDKSARDYWIVRIGDNMDDHFAVWEYLRIWKTGLIEKLDLISEKDGDDWVVDFRPA